MRSTTRGLFRYPALAALVIFCAAAPQQAYAAGALVTYFNFNDGNKTGQCRSLEKRVSKKTRGETTTE